MNSTLADRWLTESREERVWWMEAGGSRCWKRNPGRAQPVAASDRGSGMPDPYCRGEARLALKPPSPHQPANDLTPPTHVTPKRDTPFEKDTPPKKPTVVATGFAVWGRGGPVVDSSRGEARLARTRQTPQKSPRKSTHPSPFELSRVRHA